MNLIIGETSQLAKYFPSDYERISSRNIDFNYLRSNVWEDVYLTFGELRIYDTNIDFYTPNYTYTLDIIKTLLDRSRKIVIYTTGELWNKCVGRITMEDEINYFEADNDYLPSKEKMFRKIHELRKWDDRYNKVVMIHPLYFNSIYRSEYFLMGKVFNSIIHKKKITIGNTHFHRDIVHTKHVVEKSIAATSDLMVGAGRLYYVNDFIRDLYDFYSLDYDEYVTEDFEVKKINGFEKLYYSYQPEPYDYSKLLEDTIIDIDLIWSFRNRLDVLKKSIETADKTTPKELEFCLVDAASSDETIRGLREYCNSIPGRTIRIVESTYRSGLGEAWNWGMMHTDNRYVIFTSSDVEFVTPSWFVNLTNHHKNSGSQYILMENHAVFMFDKMVIPKMGWFDEEFKPGPHFDPDFMIRASENGVMLTIISKAGGYKHIGEESNEMVERSTKEMPDRLPMNDFFNEDYFKSKWQCGWPGWRGYVHSEHKPHPPTNISQVKRLIPEVDPHPIYTKKINNN